MFASRPRTEIGIRSVLIAAILFNALASNPVLAQTEGDSVTTNASQTKVGKQEGRSIPNFPTFERPVPRLTTECDDVSSTAEEVFADRNMQSTEAYKPVALLKNNPSFKSLDKSQSTTLAPGVIPQGACGDILQLMGFGHFAADQIDVHSDTIFCAHASTSTISCRGTFSGDWQGGLWSQSVDQMFNIDFVVPQGTSIYITASVEGTYDPDHNWIGYCIISCNLGHFNEPIQVYKTGWPDNNGLYHIFVGSRISNPRLSRNRRDSTRYGGGGE